MAYKLIAMQQGADGFLLCRDEKEVSTAIGLPDKI